MCIDGRAMSIFFESFNPKESFIMKTDIQINMVILQFFVEVQVVSLYPKIQPGLSGLLYLHRKSIGLISRP